MLASLTGAQNAYGTAVSPSSAGALAAAGAEPTAEQVEAFKKLQAEQEQMRREYAQMQVSLHGARLTQLCCTACWGGWAARLLKRLLCCMRCLLAAVKQ